jgi:hypothetical protein
LPTHHACIHDACNIAAVRPQQRVTCNSSACPQHALKICLNGLCTHTRHTCHAHAICIRRVSLSRMNVNPIRYACNRILHARIECHRHVLSMCSACDFLSKHASKEHRFFVMPAMASAIRIPSCLQLFSTQVLQALVVSFSDSDHPAHSKGGTNNTHIQICSTA